jgi:uncharacterized protein (DUF433 family)
MQLPAFLIDHPDGEIRLKGHRIGLYEVLLFYKDGESPEELLRRYPSLSRPLIESVIAFYEANRAEVDAYVARHEADLERLRATAPKGPTLTELRQRLGAKKQAGRTP